MKKLFSIKFLAFAGAAAFALTLAAAPQADAANRLTALLDYEHGILQIYPNGNTLTETDDGYVIYYQVGRTIKDNKYKEVALQDSVIDISSLIGKETTISLSVDGKKADAETATSVAIAASPKVKAEYSAVTSSVTLSGDITGPLASGASLGFVAQLKRGAYGEWETVEGFEHIVDQARALGTTIYIRVAKGVETKRSNDLLTPWSKETKVKIAAQAKAPKVSLKLDAKKAFSWKITNKQQYQIQVGNSDRTSWATGSNKADDWSKIFTTAKVTTEDAKVVSGDAITSDIKIFLRTAAANKKGASAINIIELKKSAESPTSAAVVVKGLKQVGKTSSGASIQAQKDIQYTTDGKSWKVLKSGKTVSFTKRTETYVFIRTAGVSKNGMVLPSLNTRVDINHDTGVATVTELTYSGSTVNAAVTTRDAE